MGISPEKSNLANAATGGQPAFFRSLHRKILHRRSLSRSAFLAATLAWVAVLGAASAAQEERPQITPGERKPAKKKDAGPRALGLLQLSSDGKASLVPIVILMNGKYYDAAAYKAMPVPMALDSGTVYEGERTGNSLGLFTIGGALHSNAVNTQTPWIATGAWVPVGMETPKTTHTAESVPVGIDAGDGPPRLTRNPGAVVAPPASSTPASSAPVPASGDGPPRLTKPDSTPAATTPPSSSTPPAAPSGDGPPRLTKSTPSTAPSAAPASAPQAEAKPADTKADAKIPERQKAPESDSGAGAGNRPTLRRGKPTGPLPEDEIPGYSKPGAVPSASPAKLVEAAAAKGPIQLIPAISDGGGPDPRSFTFEWLKDEEGERRQQMTALAKEQFRAYLDAQAKAKIGAKPAGTAAKRSAAKKAAEPTFSNPQMIAYDLWTTNQPVMVFSATAHVAQRAWAEATPDSDLEYWIVLVARVDMYNNLHKLYVGVTDKFHLDLVPRLELIDAVDVDGDGRGELLFRETSDAGSGWIVYRASADKLWTVFDSLNQE